MALLLPSKSLLAFGAYTLGDLEVLVSENSHDEFFTHALDIRPSERQGPWREMVAKMGDQYTKTVLSRSEIKLADYQKVESLYKWPTLLSDDLYRARRQEIGLRYLKSCLKGQNPCLEKLKAFWEADQSDPDTAIKLAELVHQLPESQLSVWSFLNVALKSPLSEFYCKKEFVMNGLWSKLELDYVRMGFKGDLLKKIDETVHPDCLPQLNYEARSRLVVPKKATDRELAFHILNVQSKADQQTTDFFHTVYLLEQPSQGELFNYSWNRLNELGRSLKRRESVLKMLRKMDPLPDEILGSIDQTKKRVILTHFKQHFPEYIDLYTDQCVLFYGGKGSFPKGNPTIHCQEFMKSELAPQFLDESKLKEFQSVRNI